MYSPVDAKNKLHLYTSKTRDKNRNITFIRSIYVTILVLISKWMKVLNDRTSTVSMTKKVNKQASAKLIDVIDNISAGPPLNPTIRKIFTNR